MIEGQPKIKRFWIQSIPFREAKLFVKKFHSYQTQPTGCLFNLQVNVDEIPVGVAIVGRPISPHNQDGFTAEILRLCMVRNFPDAASFLASRCWRAAKHLGYRRLITYVASDKVGTLFLAANFKKTGQSKPTIWHGTRQPKIQENLFIQRFEISDSTPSKQPKFNSLKINDFYSDSLDLSQNII